MKIAVTGATGFVGKRLIANFREGRNLQPISLTDRRISEISLEGIETVIHLAGKAHDMGSVPDEIYFTVNYDLTRQLAERAREQGVRHFIYVSSVKVYGDEASGFLDETTPCQPTDAYGRSKLKAEEYLQSVRSETFKVAIVRPPLVYGPGVKGNMIRLLELSGRDIPLPFGNAGNARSMVFIDNLIELIFRIVDKQAEGVFVAGDREPMSTDRLITMMRRAMGRSPGLFSLPTLFRKIIRKFRPALYTRLFGSFVIDNQATNRTLDFVPPYPSEAGIREMVAWFNKINGK